MCLINIMGNLVTGQSNYFLFLTLCWKMASQETCNEYGEWFGGPKSAESHSWGILQYRFEKALCG